MSASFFFFIFTASTILQMNNGEYLHCLLGRRCPAQTKIVYWVDDVQKSSFNFFLIFPLLFFINFA
jgi:hypothetical protein